MPARKRQRSSLVWQLLPHACAPHTIPSHHIIILAPLDGGTPKAPALPDGARIAPSPPPLPHPAVLILPFLSQTPYILKVWSCLEQIPSPCASVSPHTENWDSLTAFFWEPGRPGGEGAGSTWFSTRIRSPCLPHSFCPRGESAPGTSISGPLLLSSLGTSLKPCTFPHWAFG